jgi:hypothetical protein
MRTTIRIVRRSPLAENGRSRRFSTQPLQLSLFVLMLIAGVALSSILAGASTGSLVIPKRFHLSGMDHKGSAAGLFPNQRSTSVGNMAPFAASSPAVNGVLPPTISKLFLPATVAPDGTTLLSFTISNPNSAPNPDVTLTGIAFTDNFPAGLVIASPNEVSTDCGGVVTATPGSSSFVFSGGALDPAPPDGDARRSGLSLFTPDSSTGIQTPVPFAQGACFITVKVQAPGTPGTLNNTTDPITATESGPGSGSNTATLTIAAPPLPPTIAKEFGMASVPLNGTTTLTFTLGNPNSDVALLNVSASDPLPLGLVVADENGLNGNCEGDITAAAGSNTIGITALNLAPATTCSFSVNVIGKGAGTKNNISDHVSGSYDDGTGDLTALTGGTASASLEVLQATQTITFGALTSKTFGDADFTVSAAASSGLPVSFTAAGSCTVTNLSPATVQLTGPGSCTITAAQSGNADYLAAANVPQSFTVAKAGAEAAVTSSANPSFAADTVTFTAQVTGPANTGIPTGTVQFTIDSGNVGSPLTLDGNGAATFSTSSLTAGNHTVAVAYSGDDNFAADTGALAGGQTVNNRPLISLSQANYDVEEGTGFITVTVNRTGDTAVPILVDYATDDTGASAVCSVPGTRLASARCDFGLTLGTLKFAAAETQQTFIIPINQDSFTEGPELFTVNLSNLRGSNALFASPVSATVTITDSAPPAPNASDDTAAFVRQQYRDFLNREADGPGLAFWSNEIDSCGADAACRSARRVNVSAAFFLSIEFQTTGNLVRNCFVATLDRPLTNNMPAFEEFERDTQAMQRGVIVGQGNWQQTLIDNRDAFLRDFVMRPEFLALYPTTDSPEQYVDKLFLHAGITPSSVERINAVAEFGSTIAAADPGARGRALLDVTLNTTFRQREVNRSFVQMEYFGYLRRDPNDAPDGNFSGYNFWLNKLNAAGGDFVSSEMVKAFITSAEYRHRFGP